MPIFFIFFCFLVLFPSPRYAVNSRVSYTYILSRTHQSDSLSPTESNPSDNAEIILLDDEATSAGSACSDGMLYGVVMSFGVFFCMWYLLSHERQDLRLRLSVCPPVWPLFAKASIIFQYDAERCGFPQTCFLLLHLLCFFVYPWRPFSPVQHVYVFSMCAINVLKCLSW